MSLQNAQKCLDRAKVKLMANPKSAFLVSVCLSLRHVWDSSIPTAQTNGKQITYNPDFVLSLTEAERVFLLMHETMHVALQHVLRLKKRDAKLWNVAADYVINIQLVDQGFALPSGGLLSSEYRGMSTEQVYELIKGEPLPPCNYDIVEVTENVEEAKAALDDVLVQAATYATIRGAGSSIPKDIQSYLDTLLNPVLPWNVLLSNYLVQRKSTGRAYLRPNRRFFPKDLLPSRFGKGLDHIAVAIDTSGSISVMQFKRFISEAYGILTDMQPKKMDLIQFDYIIRAVDCLRTVADMEKVVFTGRGGTDVNELTTWANENKPDVLVIFSDGYFPRPHVTTQVPTIWIIHTATSFNAPYGKTIYFKE